MENKVLATVGSYEITEKELNEIISKYPADRKMMFESEQGKKQLLEQMIQFELLNQFGNKRIQRNSCSFIKRNINSNDNKQSFSRYNCN